jgi:putative FmdB family regulatory protein
MPIYEYQCAKCGVIEVMQGIKERALKRCPKCHSKVERMLSQSSFVLKGSGWYATDYARKGAASKTDGGATASDGKAATPSESGASNGTPSTSAAKPESKSDKPTAAKTGE